MVEEMEQRMSNQEFVRWSIFYARQAQRRDLAEKMAGARR